MAICPQGPVMGASGSRGTLLLCVPGGHREERRRGTPGRRGGRTAYSTHHTPEWLGLEGDCDWGSQRSRLWLHDPERRGLTGAENLGGGCGDPGSVWAGVWGGTRHQAFQRYSGVRGLRPSRPFCWGKSEADVGAWGGGERALGILSEI